MKNQTRLYLGSLLQQLTGNSLERTANAANALAQSLNQALILFNLGQKTTAEEILANLGFLPQNDVDKIRTEIDKLEAEPEMEFEPQLKKDPAQKMQMPTK